MSGILPEVDQHFDAAIGDQQLQTELLATKARYYMAQGKPNKSYGILQDARSGLERFGGPVLDENLAWLMFFQGVTGLRIGENENCIMCRGESSCILPISAAAVHQHETGSRLAIRHFQEYLEYFPDDLEVRWLLNLAYMTLGEYPDHVNPRYLVSLARYCQSEADIGRFRDIGHRVGVNRFNQAGGAILDDFDGDGLLDLAISSFDPQVPFGIYRNKGDGKFEDCSEAAGVANQLGGLYCVQTDFNNDGLLDIYIPRGAWLPHAVRPTLLRNDGELRFTDVTREAGLVDAANSITAQWADYDNDGWLDLFVCCERQPQRLYRNVGNGSFEEVAHQAGLRQDDQKTGKGCAWIDYDNDNFPDLFVNYMGGTAQLYHNDRDGTFTNVTEDMGIDGPQVGFSCWAWDYNNDGWLDIFATSYDRTVDDVVRGLLGEPHRSKSNRLFLNRQGRGFRDVTKEAGLDMVFSAMGSNFGDFDNDGFLDFYLGTGDPNYNMLVPNRMFKNLRGEHFVEITASSGVGHLQKGHAISCGDWDRDGNVDIYIEMGGAVDGDKYHNILFQNPGHEHSWITIKLNGKQTNRAALGARIKVVTEAVKPLTIHRHVSSGSSFGANPLEQTIGLADASKIATLEIRWPTSGVTQTFRDVAVNQMIEITESDGDYVIRNVKRIPLPE